MLESCWCEKGPIGWIRGGADHRGWVVLAWLVGVVMKWSQR